MKRSAMSNLRGGLAVATIGASACFGAVCGSSIATAATMTPISLREMRKAGYSDTLATGAIAAGGTLGILFPPSIILVIYGAIAQQSVPKLFAAGLIPGLLLTGLYVAVALGTTQQRRAVGHTFHADLRGALVTLAQTSSQARQLANKCVFVIECSSP